MRYTADLHLHSCLSPCASLEMSPRAIVMRAKEQGLTLLALTDHNSALNCPAFEEVCREQGIAALFGIEAMTREEVHVLCLFDTSAQALALGDHIYEKLPDVKNIPEKFGSQVVVDAHDIVQYEVEKYLVQAADMSLEDLARKVEELGGLFIPAHIEREAFSLTSQLGFLPDEPYVAVEVSRNYFKRNIAVAGIERYPIITGSDAHQLDAIGQAYTEIDADMPDRAGLGRAFARRAHLSPQVS